MTPQALHPPHRQRRDSCYQFMRDFAHVDSLAAELLVFANRLREGCSGASYQGVSANSY